MFTLDVQRVYKFFWRTLYKVAVYQLNCKTLKRKVQNIKLRKNVLFNKLTTKLEKTKFENFNSLDTLNTDLQLQLYNLTSKLKILYWEKIPSETQMFLGRART